METIDRWLTEQQRRLLHDEIQAYARGAAGTRDDLDEDMEAAALEHRLATLGTLPEPLFSLVGDGLKIAQALP